MRPETALQATVLFLLNGVVAFRLFRTEYFDNLDSVEGVFVGLERYIQSHHPMFGWLPIWFEGMPFSFVYQPALHYAVAWTATLFALSPAAAYHAVTAVTYSLGPVSVFFLLKRLCAEDNVASWFAFAGAGLYSLFSPALLLIPAIGRDAGGIFHAQRLHAMVTYGEGPNVTGLTLVPLALLFVDRWCQAGSRIAFALASVAIAAVLITSWPSSVVLALALACYVAASDAATFLKSAMRITAAGCVAYALACPFALPSMMWQTYSNANIMGDGPVRNAAYFISWSLLLLALIALRAAFFRANYAVRFAVLWTLLLAWIVFCAAWFKVLIVPQAMRFHLALEMAVILLLTLAAQRLLRTPTARSTAAVAVALFCCFQLYNYRAYAKSIIRRIDISQTIEWQASDWLRRNMPAARVFAPGSISFWMNAFTDNPQVMGCCDQSVINLQNRVAAYIIPAGYGTEAEDEEISLLWLKAYGARAVLAGGPGSREHYKPYTHPRKFDQRLKVLWASGDDKIFEVPWRGDPLVRVVREGDIVQHPPVNGIDVAEMRHFVDALDDASLPVASVRWDSPELGQFHVDLEADQVVSVAINWHSGWTAEAAGHAVPVVKDGLGFIVLKPECTGECDIRLAWHPGREVSIAIAVSAVSAVLLALGLVHKPGITIDRQI